LLTAPDSLVHHFSVEKRFLHDGGESFEVTTLDVERPSRVVLFAVGGGGNPERHAPLLCSLAERDCVVVAPHFERLVSPTPTDEHLLLRARRLKLALDSVARPGVPVSGVGHSIGATMLLALTGGEVWMRPGAPLPIGRDERIERLALMAPATNFFRAPGALDPVRTPLLVWAGTDDTITPSAQAEFLSQTLGARLPVTLHAVEGAGHFSFMNILPTHVSDPLANREAFLAALASEICRFVDHGSSGD
jgi:pimeloyl-ACP methyl ester carboxylesterase